jgi:O-Antigen ligase
MKRANPIAGLLVLLLLESLAVKSVVFDKNDPIVAHYLFSGVVSLIILIYLACRTKLRKVASSIAGGIPLLMAAAWLVLSTLGRISLYELSAIVGFGLLVLCFYVAIPAICVQKNVSLRRILIFGFGAVVIGSIAMLVVRPELAQEEPSMRFRGMLISVAVACNVFFFSSVYMVWAFKFSHGRGRWKYAILALASFVLLLFTLTKSSILEATLAALFLLVTDRLGRVIWRRVGVAVIVVLSLPAIALPFMDLELTLVSLRIIDGNLSASRDSNWQDGVDRAMKNPVFGSGLLTKQTQGGSAGVELSSEAYDSSYDAHSLMISLSEQGGAPFMILVLLLMLLPMFSFLKVHGLRFSMQSPEFLISLILFPSMMFSGGDMVSLGSLVNRLQWLFLGVLAIQSTYRGHTSVQERLRLAHHF